MTKKYVILNGILALTLLACQPASKQGEVKNLTDGQQGNGKTTENPGGGVSEVSVLVYKKIEITRTEDSPSATELSIEPKQDGQTIRYAVRVTRNGAVGEPALPIELTLSAKSELRPTIEALFAGKLTVSEKPADPKLIGAGSLVAKFTSAKDDSVKEYKEPLLSDPKLPTFFMDFIKSIRTSLDQIAKKKAADAAAQELDLSKDPSACSKINLEGNWTYALSAPNTFDNSIDVKSQLATLQTNDKSIQFSGSESAQQVGIGGPRGKIATAKVTYAVKYDESAKLCSLVQNKEKDGLSQTQDGLNVFKVLKLKLATNADKSVSLSELNAAKCKDQACKELDSSLAPIVLKRDEASAK